MAPFAVPRLGLESSRSRQTRRPQDLRSRVRNFARHLLSISWGGTNHNSREPSTGKPSATQINAKSWTRLSVFQPSQRDRTTHAAAVCRALSNSCERLPRVWRRIWPTLNSPAERSLCELSDPARQTLSSFADESYNCTIKENQTRKLRDCHEGENAGRKRLDQIVQRHLPVSRSAPAGSSRVICLALNRLNVTTATV